MTLPAWVIDTASLPVAFAQVREDPLLDLEVINSYSKEKLDVMMIASGGCTAALLASSNRVQTLHLVDANPAQLALSRLKLRLLQTSSPAQRMEMLGHKPMPARARALQHHLRDLDLPDDALGNLKRVSELGPDQAGRYESVFAALGREMSSIASELEAILASPNSSHRRERLAPGSTLGREFDAAFDRAMELPHLMKLFGRQATQNSVEPFSNHFAARTREAIASPQCTANPYLWQMLLGRFPNNCIYPWLTLRPSSQLPPITCHVSTFDQALSNFENALDFIHLSNILDWLTPQQASHTLHLTCRALRSGGLAFIRQLNSSLEIPSLAPAFHWLADRASDLHSRDRSFFYRYLHLGQKR